MQNETWNFWGKLLSKAGANLKKRVWKLCDNDKVGNPGQCLGQLLMVFSDNCEILENACKVIEDACVDAL